MALLQNGENDHALIDLHRLGRRHRNRAGHRVPVRALPPVPPGRGADHQRGIGDATGDHHVGAGVLRVAHRRPFNLLELRLAIIRDLHLRLGFAAFDPRLDGNLREQDRVLRLRRAGHGRVLGGRGTRGQCEHGAGEVHPDAVTVARAQAHPEPDGGASEHEPCGSARGGEGIGHLNRVLRVGPRFQFGAPEEKIVFDWAVLDERLAGAHVGRRLGEWLADEGNATKAGDGYTLSGEKMFVIDGHVADTIVVVEGKRVSGRLECPRGCRDIEQLLAPWLR